MKTLSELKAFCETCNVRYKLTPRYARDEYYDYVTERFEKVQVGWNFGMNNITGYKGKSEYQWTWFETYKNDINDDSVFFFAERFSQVNGKSYKGINESFTANRTMERRMSSRA